MKGKSKKLDQLDQLDLLDQFQFGFGNWFGVKTCVGTHEPVPHTSVNDISHCKSGCFFTGLWQQKDRKASYACSLTFLFRFWFFMKMSVITD